MQAARRGTLRVLDATSRLKSFSMYRWGYRLVLGHSPDFVTSVDVPMGLVVASS